MNPKVSGAWFVRPAGRASLDEDPGRRRHRHQAADGVRDRVHRQSRPQAGAQPQLRAWRRARLRRIGARRRRDVLRQSVRRPHRHRGPRSGRRQPVSHGQHRQRHARRGLEMGARWRPVGAVDFARAPRPGSTPKSWAWTTSSRRRRRRIRSATRSSAGRAIRLSFDVSWTHTRASAFATVNGRGEMRDLEPNFASDVYENPGFGTVNIGGAVRHHPPSRGLRPRDEPLRPGLRGGLWLPCAGTDGAGRECVSLRSR